MWNIWGNKNTKITQPEKDVPQQEQPIYKIDYQCIQKIHSSLKVCSVNYDQAFKFPNQSVVGTFEDVMGALHGLLNVIEDLKNQIKENQQKLSDYDKIKSKLERHNQIVKEFQQRQQQLVQQVYQQRQNGEDKWQPIIQKLNQQNSQLNEDARLLLEQNRCLKENCEQLKKNLNDLQSKYDQNLKDKNLCTQQLEMLLKLSPTSTLKSPKSSIYQSKMFSLGFCLKYQKIRKQIYCLIDPPAYRALMLSNQEIYYIMNKTLKNQYIPIYFDSTVNNYQSQLSLLREAEKMYDRFPPDNIKTNAIKYLFFKMKPGSYILPFINGDEKLEEPEIQKNEESKSNSKWGSLFKWKQQIPKKQQIKKEETHNKLSLDSLKNQEEFREVQNRVQTFFDKLFKIQLPTDLHQFHQTVQKQLNQLKKALKGIKNRPSKLLILTKFLYLQTNQLNNLLQVCFALLINEHSQLVVLKKKCNDLQQNQGMLRNLVENVANQRASIERRIWQLENQALNAKKLMEKNEKVTKMKQRQHDEYQQIIKQLKQSCEQLKEDNQKLVKQVDQYQHKIFQITDLLKQFQ